MPEYGAQGSGYSLGLLGVPQGVLIGSGNDLSGVPSTSMASDKEARGVGQEYGAQGRGFESFYFMLKQSLAITTFSCFPFQDHKSLRNKHSLRKNNHLSFTHNKMAREFSQNPQGKK